MAVLLDADGPFKGCSPERGHSTRLEPLPAEPAPEGTFDYDPADDESAEADDAAPDEPAAAPDDAAADEPVGAGTS